MDVLRSLIPEWSKPFLRFIRYPQERRRFFREWGLVKIQDDAIAKLDASSNHLIVFLVPGADRETGNETISGGVLSLVSLCEETARLEQTHHAVTIMCTFPGERLLTRHNNFENSTPVFRFEQLPQYFVKLASILIHIPEFLADQFIKRLSDSEMAWLRGLKQVHVNIINANILLMPPVESIRAMHSITSKITITAAHSRYCTPYYRSLYGFPLHKFSAWISPEQYVRREWREKSNLLVVSPDGNEHRDRILDIIKRDGSVQVMVLQGLTHQDFKEKISNAKWALTFGEGLDGYILEPIFSGAIGFAVYNEDFFTEDFKEMDGIYQNYEMMATRLMDDIRQWGSPSEFTAIQQRQFDICAKHYNSREYTENIRKFYEGDYTFK